MATQAIQLETYRTMGRSVSILPAILLIAGLFFPTSVSGEISKLLTLAAYVLCSILLAIAQVRNHSNRSPASVAIALSIVPILLVFSLISPLRTFTPGALVPYCVLSLFLCSDVSLLRCHHSVRRVFVGVNFAILVAGFAVIAGEPNVRNFLINHYSTAYPDLVENMLSWRKPVLTFGTHSLAAFYFYLFFYANLRTYEARRSQWYLFFAISDLLLMLALFSVSGLVFSLVAGFQLLKLMWSCTRRLFWATLFAAAIGPPVVYQAMFSGVDDWGAIFTAARAIVTEPDSGWRGRFGGGGMMQYDLRFLRNNPLTPVGITSDERMMFGDSAPIEYLLRGSLLLLFAVYAGYTLFLSRNVPNRSDRRVLFLAMLAFELGYSALLAMRTVLLLTFLIVYLNSLPEERERVHLD